MGFAGVVFRTAQTVVVSTAIGAMGFAGVVFRTGDALS
jgi:hypothetical protein